MLKKSKKNQDEKQKKPKKMTLGKRIFSRFFAFEKDLDLTDEVVVLKRRNQVIKNIIFIINILLFIMMTLYSSITNSFSVKAHKIVNWVITAASFPLTFTINFFLKKLIKKGKNIDKSYNLAKQQIAMYFAISYLIIVILLFYVKINFPGQFIVNRFDNYKFYLRFQETFSYLLFYVVIGVTALYQDKKLLFNMMMILFSILTLGHCFLTHNLIHIFQNHNSVAIRVAITDIVLRTFVYFIFSGIIYATTLISIHLQTERKKELLKRKDAEEDFEVISTTITDLIKASPTHFFNVKDVNNIFKIADHVATLLGFSKIEHEKMKDYASIHIKNIEAMSDNSFMQEENVEKRHKLLREKTLLAAKIIKRIQLANKAENIIRSYTERRINDAFVQEQNQIQKNDISDCLLLAEIYYRLRNPENYKAPLRHADALTAIKGEFSKLFDLNAVLTFSKFNQDFEKIYIDLD